MLSFAFGPYFYGVVLGFLSILAIILLRKRELAALLKLFCGCLCSMSLLHDAVAWSAVCDCGISCNAQAV